MDGYRRCLDGGRTRSTRRYFRSYRLLRIPVGRLCSSWGRHSSIVCRARINSLVNCHYHRVL